MLWPALDALRAAEGGESPQEMKPAPLKVQVSSMRSSLQKNDVEEGKILATRVLTANGEPVKKHVEIRLPPGVHYRPGDYLTVLPVNPKNTVQRAMRRFGLSVT